MALIVCHVKSSSPGSGAISRAEPKSSPFRREQEGGRSSESKATLGYDFLANFSNAKSSHKTNEDSSLQSTRGQTQLNRRVAQWLCVSRLFASLLSHTSLGSLW